MVFEHSAAGITAAHRAGMRVVGIGATAAQHQPDMTVPDLSGISITADQPSVTIVLPHPT